MPKPKLVKKNNDLSALVDELGELKSKIADLEVREKEIKIILCESGETLVRGQYYQAAITESERVSLDQNLVKQYLTTFQIVSCQRITSYTAVRVSARSEY